MKYFNNVNTLDELRKEYRRLSMIHHPDKGGDPEVMKEVNNEYEKLFDSLKAAHNARAAADETGRTRPIYETAEQFRDVINKIINIPDIIIELCGSWIWVSGNTQACKDILKSAGMFWASKKKMWYWRCKEDASHGRGSKDMSYIRNKYGSERITSDGRRADLLPA